MDTNLVPDPGFDFDPNQGVFFEGFERLNEGDCWPAVSVGGREPHLLGVV
jgi:hypothetical protein